MANSTFENQNRAWIYGGSGGSYQLPTKWKEILILAYYTGTDGSNWSYTITIPNVTDALGKRYFSGFYANSGSNFVAFQELNGTITHQSFFVDGTDRKASSHVKYYYR